MLFGTAVAQSMGLFLLRDCLPLTSPAWRRAATARKGATLSYHDAPRAGYWRPRIEVLGGLYERMRHEVSKRAYLMRISCAKSGRLNAFQISFNEVALWAERNCKK